MTLKDRILYHQVHPLKLLSDAVICIISTYLFWKKQMGVGLFMGILPSAIISVAIVIWADLNRIAYSKLGRYVRRHITWPVAAIRWCGQIIMWIGAWEHSTGILLLGIFTIVTAWLNGFFSSERSVK